MDIIMTLLNDNIEKNNYHKLIRDLPNNIKDKVLKYHHLEDQYRTLLGYTLLKNRLVQTYGLALSDFQIEYSVYGKPYLTNNIPIYFNISHANNIVVCAIDTQDIGVDIEYQRPTENILEIAKRFFHVDEYTLLLNQTSSLEVEKCFYRLWTAKESYIKWIGMGLALELRSFSIFHNQGETFLRLSEEGKVCYFKYFNIEDNYHIHICSNNREGLITSNIINY